MNSIANNSLKRWMTARAICLFVALLTLPALSLEVATAQTPMPRSMGKTKIVLDPGHGGADTGAKGPTGLMEKAVTLELVRQLALKLEPQYEVVLTRRDDYSVELHQRAATANQSKADLMISLHTGAGFLHRTDGLTVYYYDHVKGRDPSEAAPNGTHTRHKWDQAQKHHKSDSLSLARALADHLEKAAGLAESNIQGMPIKLLEGADMPAVLVEVGHITHPATEKSLSSNQGIDIICNAIKEGIGTYLKAGPVSHRR